MIECEAFTSRERLLFKLCHQLDKAFRRDSSIGAMNRAYRKLRSGQPEIDRELRDHIGLLYLFEKARPALLKAMKQDRAEKQDDNAANGHEADRRAPQIVDVMDPLRTNSVSESERSLVEV